ncbi:MAG: MOP flippase family protein [Bacteroidales bacterium]|nr:MOP flippase family protein [Bacteroidales bacterium]MDD3961932.1 MOP flippase family protein [Bacteroidales bacterium]MDY0286636.1 MOP flippase family protein [Bacteroidales bacterium]
MTETLKQQTAKGVLWSAIERFSVQGLQFMLGLILARILMPEDYGLVGMLTIFIALSQSIVDSGFSSALIQKKDRNETDYSTAFFFNIGIGLFLYFILFFSAPLIADFYDMKELTNLTKVVGINVFIASLTIVQRAKLTIALDFKTQARASFTAVLIGGILGITLAYKGFGVWALVAQTLTRNSINSVLLWILSKWVPNREFSIKSFKCLFSFGSKLLGAGLLNTIFENIYLLVIGKLFSATDLGFYTRAKQFQKLPSQNITQIIQRVTFPVLSSIQDEEEKLRKAYISFIRMSAYIVFPLMIGLAMISKPLILIVLTDKWLPVVPLLQILCIAGMLYPVQAINLNILNVRGRSDLFLRLEIIKKVIIAITILITWRWGVIALVWGQVVIAFISYFLNTYYTEKFIQYTTWTQLKDLFLIAVLSAPMIFTLFIIQQMTSNNLVQLLCSITLGGATYYFTGKVFKTTELKEIRNLIRRKK